MEEGESDKGNESDKDGFRHEPVYGKEEVLDVFIHQGSLDVGFVELRNTEGLVDDNAVRDDGTNIGCRVPSRKTTARGCKHERSRKIAETGKEAEKVTCRPNEVRRRCRGSCLLSPRTKQKKRRDGCQRS